MFSHVHFMFIVTVLTMYDKIWFCKYFVNRCLRELFRPSDFGLQQQLPTFCSTFESVVDVMHCSQSILRDQLCTAIQLGVVFLGWAICRPVQWQQIPRGIAWIWTTSIGLYRVSQKQTWQTTQSLDGGHILRTREILKKNILLEKFL